MPGAADPNAPPYDAKSVDGWAMGVMMYLLVTGKFPFEVRVPPGGCVGWSGVAEVAWGMCFGLEMCAGKWAIGAAAAIRSLLAVACMHDCSCGQSPSARMPGPLQKKLQPPPALRSQPAAGHLTCPRPLPLPHRPAGPRAPQQPGAHADQPAAGPHEAAARHRHAAMCRPHHLAAAGEAPGLLGSSLTCQHQYQ